MIYAVVDTNVFVSALLSRHADASTVKVVEAFQERKFKLLFNKEIFIEYYDVLFRPRLKLPEEKVQKLISQIGSEGIASNRLHSDEFFPDPKDVVFCEVALSKEDAYLVTGNTKHFPKKPIVVTPVEMLEVLRSEGLL
jgi:putative PIN family toxin of toxin-antitoxin system